jgi:membrane fusion protein (multidrug efflux system)
VAGIIREIHFEEGQPVAEGELLFSLEDEKIRERSKARQAALKEARAELENARRTFRRRQRLFEQDLGTEESRDAAETALEAAKARVDRLLAEIGEIKEILRDTRIKAPFAGTLGERKVDPGDWVDVGTPLVYLVDPKRLQTSFTVPERYAERVQEGQPIEITTPGHSERAFSGEVYFVSPQIEVSTRKLLVKAYVENAERILRPGGFASVELTVGTRQEAVVIPEEALIPTRSGYQVFVVQEGRAKSRTVSIGLRKPGIVEVRQGLQAGEKIISSGHISAREGSRVCERSSKDSS